MAYINKEHRFPWEVETQALDKKGSWTRDPEIAKKYKTKRWTNLRRKVLQRDKYCQEHLNKGEYIVPTVADHIKPVSQGGDFWDEDNLQGLCKSCHNKKSAKERIR